MYVRRNLRIRFIFRFVWPDLILATVYNFAIFLLFFFVEVTWIDVPFELVSTVGLAVAFLIGFKNNQAYDRFWEGRKIWGKIVNYSRAWATQVVSLIGIREGGADITRDELREHHRVLIYRHIAWLNALRVQLRAENNWTVRENFLVERFIARHRQNISVPEAIKPFVDPKEGERLEGRANVAFQLLGNQARQLETLRHDKRLIDGFDLILLTDTLSHFHDYQGMCERIKNTPFPRQFAYFSKIFTVLFCMLLPLGLIDLFEEAFIDGLEFAQTFATPFVPPSGLTFLVIAPLSILISLVFLTWEQIGNNSEEPFEDRPFDVSMTALCRTIEIDLRDILGEENLPPKIQPKDHILN